MVAQGSHRVENPLATLGVTATHYGYHGDGPLLPAPGDFPSAAHKVEATKTEPDKNTYLVLRGQRGADPGYDYGPRFLFQGHEIGARSTANASVGTITRINLDADGVHRVTVLAVADVNGTPLPVFDGSIWDPWANRLLFTAEGRARRRRLAGDARRPVRGRAPTGILGQAGYEGIQIDQTGTSGSSRTAAASRASTAPLQAAEQLRLPLRADGPARSHARRQARGLCRSSPAARGNRSPSTPGQAAADIFSDGMKRAPHLRRRAADPLGDRGPRYGDRRRPSRSTPTRRPRRQGRDAAEASGER